MLRLPPCFCTETRSQESEGALLTFSLHPIAADLTYRKMVIGSKQFSRGKPALLGPFNQFHRKVFRHE
jgi:hypothetical protein